MNDNQLIKLLKEEGYPSHMIENTILKLRKLSYPIDESFENWCTTGVLPLYCIGGYTFEKLTQDYKMKPVGAFLTLDWLVREPEKASAALLKGKK